MVSLARPVYIPVRAIMNKFGDDITRGIGGQQRRVSREGENLGRAFSQGFNRGVDTNAFRRVANGIRSMVPEADAARAAFSTMVRTSYTLGTALSVVVGGISSAIGGLISLGGAALGAASTVTVLGNAFFALGAGMVVSRLALGGVGKALTALNKQTSRAAATSTRTALQSVRDSQAREAAARRIEDAERSLARTIESNADRIAAANRDIYDAQSALNRAIRDGREEMQQLGFDAEDAALSEQAASLELEKARERLAKVQDLPPNNRARREAELAYQEAELNYRKAKDANADLADEQNRLAKSGVNGLSSVIDARNKLADAEAAKAKTVKDALQSEEDALRDVADARKAAQNVDERQDATPDTGAAGAGLGAAWDKGLNEAQRNFVLFLNSLRPKIDELKRIAAEAFLPQLQDAIQNLADNAYPTIARGVGIVATAMGAASVTLSQIITESDNLDKLNSLFESSGRIIELLGNSFGRVYDILLSILNGSAPMAERFFGFIDQKLSAFAGYLDSVEGNQALTNFFRDAEYTANLFGDVLGNIFGSIGAVIQANIGPGTGGELLLTWLKEITAPPSGDGLKQYFLDVANNTTKIGDALGAVVGVFKNLAANENIGKTFETLSKPENVAAFENIMTAAVNAGPSLATLVGTITKIVSAMTDTGAMQVFFDTLNNIFTAVLDFVSDPGNKAFMDFFGRIFAVFSAVGLVAKGVGFGFKVVAGSVLGIISPIATAIGVTKNMAGAFSKFNNLMGATFTTADGITGKLTVMGTAAKVATGKTLGMSRAFEVMGAPARGFQAAIGGIGPVLTTAGRGLAVFGKALMGVMLGPVGIVIGVIAALVGIFTLLYNTNDEFKQQMDAVWADLSKTFAEAGAQIMSALQPLIAAFGDIITTLAPIIAIIIESLVPVITMLVSAIAPLIATLVQALVPAFKLVADVLGFIIPIVANIIAFVVKVLVEVLKFVITIITNIVTWIIDAITNFGTNWNNFWSGIGQFFEDMWNGLLSFLDTIWTGITTVFDAAFKWIDKYVIQPFKAAMDNMGKAFDVVGKFIAGVWQTIQDAINIVWKWIDNNIFRPIRNALDLIGWAFEHSGEIIDFAWKQMQDNLEAVWLWIDENVFGPIRGAVKLVQDAFENTGKGIAKAWEGIKEAAAVPVNFVIETVYNNGIRSFWNDIADNLNMKDLKLPKAKKVAFASGGVMPGYTPGRDVHRFYSPTAGYLHLSGGEAIMRPEWTRMMGGPRAIARMNRAASRGQHFATGGVFGGGSAGSRRFASGGVFDWAGDVIENLGDVAKIIGDFFVNPVGAVKTHLVDGLIKPLLNGGGDSMFDKLIGGFPLKIADGIGKAITSFFGSGGGGGNPAKAIGWQAMWKIVESQFPWAHLNSAYSDRIGGKTYHGKGRAIDVTPSMDIFNFLARAFPNSTELIYSPAGARQLQNGRRHLWGEPVRSAHFNHVHWAMADGGTVYPSPDGTIVRVAEAGKPERVEPLDPNGLSDRDKALIDHLTNGGGGTTINVYQQPGEDAEALARRIDELISRGMRRGSLR